MKALTICQPYADMIATGKKIIENRTWPAPRALWGQRIAIHAGKSRSWLDPGDLDARPGLVFGAIVATAVLSRCLQVDGLPPDLAARDDANGPWCWVLADVRPVNPPVAMNGAQGLWDWEAR